MDWKAMVFLGAYHGINSGMVDWVWAGALVLTGVVVLLK
jgi:hypothetical protein